MYKDISANLNQEYLILTGRCAMLIITKKLYKTRNVKSAMKHSPHKWKRRKKRKGEMMAE